MPLYILPNTGRRATCICACEFVHVLAYLCMGRHVCVGAGMCVHVQDDKRVTCIFACVSEGMVVHLHVYV